MNAIITLNHFCEIHGPQSIFTTQTIRDKTYVQNSSTECSLIKNCESCSSIDRMFFLTEDNSIMFVSSEKSLFSKDVQNVLKQAALRSLCEISTNNQEELVFFGDARINSLCYSFKVKDSYARGFEKLYSIVVLMKDKMFLLNSHPFIAHNIRQIATQIQESALKTYEAEQKQFSQRAERLNTGKLSDLPQRSLKELVGEQNIFGHLHSLFTWMLWAGARYFTEVLTLGSPTVPTFCKDSDGFAFISIDKEEFIMHNFSTQIGDGVIYDCEYNLRNLKQICKSSFNQILYYSLTGTQIVIRGRNNDFYKYFKELMPSEFHHLIVESSRYINQLKARILSISSDEIISANYNICKVEFLENLNTPASIKCPIDLPVKLPTLMTKILYAVNEEKLFTNQTMHKYIISNMEEWKNKVLCLSHHSHDLKKVLEIQPHDEDLLRYWSSVFSN